jgi:hypothetical protein
VGRDGGGYRSDLGEAKTDLFLQGDLDDPNQLEIVQEFSVYAQPETPRSPTSPRHCERSEAIHRTAKKVWIASSLALLAQQ